MSITKIPIFFIGLRYLLSRKSKRAISFTSMISMAGLTLGVMALVLVLSVFNGSQGLQRDRTLITVPHGDIYASPAFSDWSVALKRLNERSDISGIAPYIPVEALLSQQGFHQVTQIRGIDPALELQVSPVEDNMLVGSLSDLTPGAHGIVIGRTLASNLRLYTGDAVNLVVPQSNKASNRVRLNMYRFTVTGIFDVQFDIGSDLAYIHLDDSMELLNLSDAGSNVHFRLETPDIDMAWDAVAQSLAQLKTEFPGPEYLGEDWSVTEASLFNALKMEKIMTGLMLMMIVAIGAFNIVSTLVMAVADKQADIAILRTMGAGQRTIMGVFLVQGCMIGVVGVALGAVLGVLLSLNFSKVSAFFEMLISPDSLYMLSELPAELHSADVWLICSVALLISFLATLYPAWKASSIHPAQVLRYE